MQTQTVLRDAKPQWVAHVENQEDSEVLQWLMQTYNDCTDHTWSTKPGAIEGLPSFYGDDLGAMYDEMTSNPENWL